MPQLNATMPAIPEQFRRQGITYHFVPTVEQFKKDSSVGMKFRKDDRILAHLDWLLERYWVRAATWDYDASLKKVILCDLFLTANFWIKSMHANNPRLEKGRYRAVLALFDIVVRDLCAYFSCSLGQIPAKMSEIFGRELTEDGKATDTNKFGAVYYHDLAVCATHRMRFRSGRAYRYESTANGPARLVPIESKLFYTDTNRPGHGKGLVNWAPFVMTLDRTFYTGKHRVGNEQGPGVYHSAYTCGSVVSGAGTMLIENGVIKGMRGDSGHYHPEDNNIIAALTALGMYGVPLQHIQMYKYDGTLQGTAIQAINAGATWDKFLRKPVEDLKCETPYT